MKLSGRQGNVCSFLIDQKGTKESPRGKHMRFRRISALSHMMFPPWNPVTKDAGQIALCSPPGAPSGWLPQLPRALRPTLHIYCQYTQFNHRASIFELIGGFFLDDERPVIFYMMLADQLIRSSNLRISHNIDIVLLNLLFLVLHVLLRCDYNPADFCLKFSLFVFVLNHDLLVYYEVAPYNSK